MNYIDRVNTQIKEYFNILEPNFQKWLNEYIEVKELLRQEYISITCGTIYSRMFKSKLFFSNLDHSIAVALITWHLTKDKKQTLASLYHDIATPAFKHSIDFLHGDYMNQEATEYLTEDILRNSESIMSLLNRDNILLKEISDYTRYSLVDNKVPRLAIDRLEYSFSQGLFNYGICTLEDVQRMYNDVSIGLNEEGLEEIAFNNHDVAREFVSLTSKLSLLYRDDKTRYSMQFLADIIKRLVITKIISIDDLYKLKEIEIIEIIKNSKYGRVFELWQNSKNVYSSKKEPKDIYFIQLSAKVRYIDPLVNNKRLSKQCKTTAKMIANNLAYDMSNYVYTDYDIDEDIYNKLVRDKIPETIQSKGEISYSRVLNEDEYKKELNKKLAEECCEVIAALTKDEILEELGDLYEVVKSIAKVNDIKLDENTNELDIQAKISYLRLLVIECNKLNKTISKEKISKHLINIINIIDSLAKLYDSNLEEVKKIAAVKKEKKGGFEKRLYLEKTITRFKE